MLPPLRSAGDDFANRRLTLLSVAINSFLAMDAIGGPGHCCEALRMDVLVAQLTYPEAAIPNSAERRAGVPELASHDPDCWLRALVPRPTALLSPSFSALIR